MGSHEFIVRGGAEEGKAVTTRAARGTRSSEGRPKQSWSAEWRSAVNSSCHPNCWRIATACKGWTR